MAEKNKPRLAEILGVEVGQEWTVEGSEYDTPYRITLSGNLQRKSAEGKWLPMMGQWFLMMEDLTNAINHPEVIKRKPCWTAEDIEDAKAAKRLFPDVTEVKKSGSRTFFYYDDDGDGSFDSIYNSALFPTLKFDERVTLDEILEAEHGQGICDIQVQV